MFNVVSLAHNLHSLLFHLLFQTSFDQHHHPTVSSTLFSSSYPFLQFHSTAFQFISLQQNMFGTPLIRTPNHFHCFAYLLQGDHQDNPQNTTNNTIDLRCAIRVLIRWMGVLEKRIDVIKMQSFRFVNQMQHAIPVAYLLVGLCLVLEYKIR